MARCMACRGCLQVSRIDCRRHRPMEPHQIKLPTWPVVLLIASHRAPIAAYDGPSNGTGRHLPVRVVGCLVMNAGLVLAESQCEFRKYISRSRRDLWNPQHAIGPLIFVALELADTGADHAPGVFSAHHLLWRYLFMTHMAFCITIHVYSRFPDFIRRSNSIKTLPDQQIRGMKASPFPVMLPNSFAMLPSCTKCHGSSASSSCSQLTLELALSGPAGSSLARISGGNVGMYLRSRSRSRPP